MRKKYLVMRVRDLYYNRAQVIYQPFHEKPYTKPLLLVKILDNFYSTNLFDFFFI